MKLSANDVGDIVQGVRIISKKVFKILGIVLLSIWILISIVFIILAATDDFIPIAVGISMLIPALVTAALMILKYIRNKKHDNKPPEATTTITGIINNIVQRYDDKTAKTFAFCEYCNSKFTDTTILKCPNCGGPLGIRKQSQIINNDTQK